jgi:hypothetical protein
MSTANSIKSAIANHYANLNAEYGGDAKGHWVFIGDRWHGNPAYSGEINQFMNDLRCLKV